MSSVTISGVTIDVPKLKLRQWLLLEEQVQQLHTNVETRDGNTVLLLCSLVSTFYGIEDVSNVVWYEVAEAFSALMLENRLPTYFPLLNIPQDEKPKPEMLRYLNRSWFVWSNAFAKAYGWTLEYIANMDVVEAFGLYHELLIDQYNEREWEWTLSENSVGYDAATKKSKRIEYPKPAWMTPVSARATQTVKPVKINIKYLPVGIVHGAKTKH